MYLKQISFLSFKWLAGFSEENVLKIKKVEEEEMF